MHLHAYPMLSHWAVEWWTLADCRSHDHAKEAGKGLAASNLSSTEVLAFLSETQQPTLFVICMTDVSYCRHHEIMPLCSQNGLRSEYIFRTMGPEKKGSNACQKMDKRKANYLGLHLSSINQVSKGKILVVPSFPWRGHSGETAVQPTLRQTAHTAGGGERLISSSAELPDHLCGS